MMNDNSKRRKILVVDDNQENIRILLEVLGDEFAVVAAHSGEKAIAIAIAAPHPDLILLDVIMPNMDGYEVCRRLKANPLTWGIPVLFVTSLSDSDDELQGLELGAVDYIIKPIIPKLLIARVRIHLELIARQKMLEQQAEELQRTNGELKKALLEIKTLQGIIPICMYCKQIRDEKGAWNRLEAYISAHSEAQFSHGVCPECYKKYMEGDLD